MTYRIHTEVIGHTADPDRIDVTVRHDPSASYSRSVVPSAVRFFKAARLGGVKHWSYTMSDITDTDPEGRCLTSVIFTVRER